MKRTTLTSEQTEWLTRTFARNNDLFGGWKMEADDDQDDSSDDSGDADDSGSDSGDDGDTDDDSDDKLAPEDDPENVAYWKKRSRQNEREAKKYRREAQAAKKRPDKAKDGDDDPDPDELKKAARAEVEAELLHGRVEDKIEAKARAFADPEDAVAVLLRSRDIEDFIDDGKIDVEAITEALAELGEKKPHLLAAQSGKRFQGGADGGARKGAKSRPKDIGEALTRHYSGKK